MNPQEVQGKIQAAYTLLSQASTTRDKFESIRTLISGINPKIDNALAKSSQALSDYEKLQKGEIIELTAQHLPENTEEDKKRKRALILFINIWKDLKNEVERIKSELESNNNQPQDTTNSLIKILSSAKGPFGLVTLAALIVVGVTLFIGAPNKNPATQQSNTPTAVLGIKQKIKVIVYQGKQIPIDQLRIDQGTECVDNSEQLPHYHAKNSQDALAVDGTIIPDPGGCGYGSVSYVKVLEIEQ